MWSNVVKKSEIDKQCEITQKNQWISPNFQIKCFTMGRNAKKKLYVLWCWRAVFDLIWLVWLIFGRPDGSVWYAVIFISDPGLICTHPFSGRLSLICSYFCKAHVRKWVFNEHWTTEKTVSALFCKTFVGSLLSSQSTCEGTQLWFFCLVRT